MDLDAASTLSWWNTPSLRRAAKGVVVLALLAWLGSMLSERQGWEELASRAASLESHWLTLAIAAQLVAVCLGVSRWKRLLQSDGLFGSWLWLFRIFLQGRFVGAFTPSTVGLDLYRAVAIRRHFNAPEAALSFVISEKLLSLIALSLFASPILLWGAPFSDQGLILQWLAALFIGSGAIFLILRQRQPLSFLTERSPDWLRKKIERWSPAISQDHLSVQTFLGTLVLSFASHVCTALVFVSAAYAVGINVDARLLLLCGVGSILAGLLPITVGGVGVREGLCLALLAPLGVSPAQVVLAGFITFLATQPPAIIGGLCHLGGKSKNIQDFRRTLAV